MDHVMRLFFRHLADGEGAAPVVAAPADPLASARAAMDVACEEASLDPPALVSASRGP